MLKAILLALVSVHFFGDLYAAKTQVAIPSSFEDLAKGKGEYPCQGGTGSRLGAAASLRGKKGWQSGSRVSIVLPILNEAERLPTLISSLQSLNPEPELIFVDGGSGDGSQELASQSGATLLVAVGATRGAAMNCGASVANGEILLFLHADCTLSQKAYDGMLQAIDYQGLIGGAFALHFEDRSHDYRLRIIEQGVRLRNHLFHLVYGDQAFFVQREAFQPYLSLPLMEDVEWFGRLKKSGKWAVLNEPITTSPRRLYQKGLLRSALTNMSLVALYELGARPERLAEIYYQKKKSWKKENIPSS